MRPNNEIEAQLKQLQKENQQLRAQLDALRQSPPDSPAENSDVFKSALSKVRDSIVMASTTGKILYANQQFYIEYGLDPDKPLPMLYEISSPDHSLADFNRRIDKIRRNGGHLEYQSEYQSSKTRNRQMHQISAFITKTRFGEILWMFMQDITELIKSRDELRELNYLLDSIIDNLPLYLFVKDVDNDLRYVYWNKAFADHSKIPASRVIGRTDFEIFPSYEDAQKFRNDDMEVIRENAPINRHETYEAADGKMRICQTLKTLIHREGRGPLLIGLSWDITNMQDIEQELVQERLRAENSDRLKSTFLANMSHEIRTPLNAIVGFSELLIQRPDDEQRAMYSEIIKQNSESLLQLINDILDISKIEAGTLEYVRAPFDLDELFENIYEANKGRMPKRVALMLDRDDCGHSVIINEDRNRIMQIITNLINNAIKFTNKGEITIGYRLAGNMVEAYVSDTGMGIPAEKLGQVFDRFVKLNTFAQGTGLGLSICKMILGIMGGDIWVESEVGKGSIFFFTIPYDSNFNIKSNKNSDNNTEMTTDDINSVNNADDKENNVILIAEDTPSNYMLLKAIIGKRYKLEWAHDGAEAVQKYKETRPRLILMDIKMPNMDGLEATRMIRTYSHTVPIIALSAFAFESDKQKAYDAGVDAYLTKPVSRQALDDVLGKYM